MRRCENRGEKGSQERQEELAVLVCLGYDFEAMKELTTVLWPYIIYAMDEERVTKVGLALEASHVLFI